MWCLPASPRICRNTFSPAEQEVGRGVSENLLFDSAVNPSQSALRKYTKKSAFCGEGWAWHEKVTVMGRCSDPKVDHVASGRRCLLRRVISGEEGWPWEARRGGRSWFTTASWELLIAPSRASPLAPALSSPVLKNQDWWWALKLPNAIWSPRSTRRASKSGTQFQGQEDAGWTYTLTKVSVVEKERKRKQKDD